MTQKELQEKVITLEGVPYKLTDEEYFIWYPERTSRDTVGNISWVNGQCFRPLKYVPKEWMEKYPEGHWMHNVVSTY